MKEKNTEGTSEITNAELLKLAHYKSLFNNSPDAVFSFDTNGNFLSANESLSKMVECPIDELLKTSFVPFADPKDLDRIFGHFQKALTGEIQNYDCGAITTSGKHLIINITNFPITIEGEIVGVYGIAKDITKAVMAERELEQRNNQLQKIMDRSLDMICTVDENGLFTQVSAASYKILGYHPEELIGVNPVEELVHKDDLESTQQAVSMVLGGDETTNLENRLLRKDGKYVSLSWSGKWYPEENLTYCVVRDATEIKRTEEKLFNYARKLKRSNEELEQFAYIASHDLQEPLRMVTSFLTQLEKKYKPQLDEKAQEYIFYAVDGATRMRRIILDLLEYSRVGRIDQELESIDLNDLIAEVIQLNKALIDETHAVIDWDHLPVIKAHHTPLQHVFQNFISNGLKYQRSGNKPVIKIEATETATHWQFSVSDNGIGIEPQFHKKIFNIFQRLHGKQEYSGSGIGLAICKKVIENYQGEIWVESGTDEGSTFYFTINKHLY